VRTKAIRSVTAATTTIAVVSPRRQALRAANRGSTTRIDTTRTIRAPRGTELSCKSWLSEAPFRMLQNNLDPEVAENPAELVVYGGIGRAARNWECFDAILKSLRELNDDETCWCSPASRSACSPRMRMRRAC
jgi:hypothetical protein